MTDTATPARPDLLTDYASDHDKAVTASMEAAGVPTTEKVQVDYFAFDDTVLFTLPDGISSVTLKKLNEGARVKYQKATTRDVRFSKGSGDAVMRLSPGEERTSLLKAAIVNWNMVRGGQAVAFSNGNLDTFLANANPVIIDLINKEVQRQNPWLLSEMSVEDIDKEIATLQEMRQVKVDEEAGKASS